MNTLTARQLEEHLFPFAGDLPVYFQSHDATFHPITEIGLASVIDGRVVNLRDQDPPDPEGSQACITLCE